MKRLRDGGMSMRFRFVVAVCMLCTGLTAAAAQARDPLLLQRHILMDRHGWQSPVEAAAVLVPADWEVKSGIDWRRKCSADRIFDTRFVAQSPDGRYGVQMFPGLRFEYFHVGFNGDAFLALIPAVPGTEAMLEAQRQQTEQEQQQRVEAYKRSIAGTDCHWSKAIDARSIVEHFVVPRRAPGGVIVDEETLPGIERILAQQTAQGPSTPGFRPRHEAKRIRVRFMNGQISTEADLLLIVYGNISRTDPSNVTYTTSHVTRTFPIVTRWAPAGELDDVEPLFATIERSWRFNPRWSAATAKVRESIHRMDREAAAARHKIWMQTQREISDSQMDAWQSRQDTADRVQQDYLDMIDEVQPMLDPISGHEVSMPIHYDDYYVNEEGQYLALEAGQDPARLFPDHIWTGMAPAR